MLRTRDSNQPGVAPDPRREPVPEGSTVRDRGLVWRVDGLPFPLLGRLPCATEREYLARHGGRVPPIPIIMHDGIHYPAGWRMWRCSACGLTGTMAMGFPLPPRCPVDGCQGLVNVAGAEIGP